MAHLGPPISLPPAQLPSPTTLQGRKVLLQHLDPSHADHLYTIIGGTDPIHTFLWTYMPEGPYPDLPSFRTSITTKSISIDPFLFAILDNTTPTCTPIGHISLMRITPAHLTAEIGHVVFSPSIQRSTHATESVYLLLRHAFEDLGYRRIEWKCDSLNAASRRAALRFGFTFEGIFRQHMVMKGRNRDTAWFSLLRDEWEGSVRGAFEGWLDEGNFEENGLQKRRLEEFR